MLTGLRIRNVAIIESVSLDLRPGLNVLSGETGAGKSMIVEALGLLFGERARGDMVRTGADRASVEGIFDVADHDDVLGAIEERGFEHEGGTVVLRREVTAAGRSRAWVNGTPATVGVLAELGHMLVAVHGQQESRALLEPNSQRAMLDAYAGATDHWRRVGEAWDALVAVRSDRAALETRRDAAARHADYLRHLTEEIGGARLEPGEEERLDEDARRLSNVVELRQLAGQLREAVDGDDGGALRQVGVAQRALAALCRLDPSLERLRPLLDEVRVGLGEFSREIADYEEALESDPSRLREVERRREVVFRLVRKHGGSVESALRALGEARDELELLDTASLDLGALGRREATCAATLSQEARALRAARSGAAQRLERAVEALLPGLGLDGGRFGVRLEPVEAPNRNGTEDVEFMVALNPGLDSRPLARVASGGELSRVMLALKTALARVDHVPTLIFDEVDSGIGGRVGLCVGDTLRAVARHHQVLAITHLAQIASRADHHVMVTKGSAAGVTTADVRAVEGDERVREVARMLGGDADSEASRAHARELLDPLRTTGCRSAARER